MINGRNVALYILDLIYGASFYPCGWLKPNVVRGYFNDNESGRYQSLFFKGLLELGFERTHWQLVFPNQTAGLVKRIPVTNEGEDECHIRFYNEGIIDCELEVNRFNGWHWAGSRKHDVNLLENILSDKMGDLSFHDKLAIRKQFGMKQYSDYCIRS
jgi:hypothetical protein